MMTNNQHVADICCATLLLSNKLHATIACLPLLQSGFVAQLYNNQRRPCNLLLSKTSATKASELSSALVISEQKQCCLLCVLGSRGAADLVVVVVPVCVVVVIIVVVVFVVVFIIRRRRSRSDRFYTTLLFVYQTSVFRLYRIPEMQTIDTNHRGVCLPVSQSVCHAAQLGFAVQKWRNGSRSGLA